VNNTLTTTGGGTVTVNESGTATFVAVADIIADGAVSLTATGGITTAADVTTTDDNVTYGSATTLNGPVNITTGAGGAGDINFSSTITGTQDLTLLAGTGNITVAGNIGAARLGTLTITSANAVAFQGTGTQQAASLVVATSTSTTFTGNLNLTNGVSLAATAGNVSFLDGLTAGTVSTFSNTGSLQLGDAAADVTSLTGGLTHTAGTTSLGGTVTAPAGATLAVTNLSADTILNTTDSAVAFNSTLDSDALEANDLTVNTGTAATTVAGAIGSAPNGALGTLTISNSAAGMILPATNAAALNVTTNGDVTDNGNLTITGAVVIDAGTNDITLGGATETTNFGSIGLTGGTVVVTEDSGTNLTGVSADAFTLTAAGNITDSAGTTINVAGLATFSAGTNSITLGDDPLDISVPNVDTTNFGSLTIANAGAVSITEDSSMNLVANTTGAVAVRGVGVNLAGVTAPSLTVFSSGPLGITDTAPLIISGTALFDAGGYNITLDDSGNNFSTVQLFGATITINDVDVFALQGLLSSGPFTALSIGDMTVTAALNAAFDLSLTARNGSLLLNAPVNSGGNLILTAGQNFQSTSTISAGGEVTIAAGGSARFTSDLQINTPFQVDAASIAFDGTLNGNATGDLQLITQGDTRFNGAIGNTGSIGALTTDAGGTTYLNGGTASVDTINFQDDVVVERDTTITATTLNFYETFGGGHNVVLNVSGDTVFAGEVGPTGLALASLTTNGTAGRTLFYGEAITTSGDQTYNTEVVLGSHMEFNVTAGDLMFNNTVVNTNDPLPLTPIDLVQAASDGPSDLTATVSGETFFNGEVGQGTGNQRLGDVSITSTDGIVIRDDFSATSATFGNDVTFDNATSATTPFTMDTTDIQDYAGEVTLVNDMTFNSGADSTTVGITFQESMTGEGRTVTLTAAQGAITTVGNVGAEDARFATISAAGRNLVVGGDIWTTGDIALAMGTNDSTDRNDYLAFTVPGSSGSGPRHTTLDSENGAIILGSGAAGTGTTDKTGAPLRASIFKSDEGDLYLLAKRIIVQPFERLAVSNGSFVAIADGTAAEDGITLSSTAASNYLVLSTARTDAAPSIFIRSRAPANYTKADGSQDLDQGTDLVGGVVLFYNALFAGEAAPRPTRDNFSPRENGFAYDIVDAPGNLPNVEGAGVISRVGGTDPVYAGDLNPDNTKFRPQAAGLSHLALDTKGEGFNVTLHTIAPDRFGLPPAAGTGDAMSTIVSKGGRDQSTVTSVFVPSGAPVESASAPPETDLAAAVREQLQALGIYARAPTPEEIEARERLKAVYVEVPKRRRPTESDYLVADARVEGRAIGEVLRLAAESGLIGDGQGGLTEIAQAFEVTYKLFSDSTPTEGKEVMVLVAEYRAWLESNPSPESTRVLAYVKSLRSTLRRIELLGLTTQELEGSKAQIYGSVLRAKLNIEPEFLQGLVDSEPVDASVAKKEPAKKPAAKPVARATVPAADATAGVGGN
jgi:hypothetical protein